MLYVAYQKYFYEPHQLTACMHYIIIILYVVGVLASILGRSQLRRGAGIEAIGVCVVAAVV